MKRLCFILIFTVAVSSFAENVLNEDERLQFADGLLARGMHELALKEYEAFLKDFPATAKADVAHFKMGECQRLLGKPAAADAEFKTVFTEYPESALRFKAGIRRGDLAAEGAQYDRAVELYNTVLKEKPPEDIAAVCIFFSGEALLKAGKTGEAAVAFEEIKAKHPASTLCPYALLKLGGLYEADGIHTNEVLGLYKTVAAKPGSDRIGAEAEFQMAELYFKRKAYADSAAAYKRLIAQFPSDPRAAESKLQAAWASHNAGLYADALAGALEGLKDATGDRKAEWMYLKANAERQLLKHDDAIQTYDQLLKDYPGCAFANAARYEKALTLYKMGKYKETIEEATRMKMTPELGKDAYWLLAESHAGLKEEEKSVQYYRLIVKEYPKSDIACDATYRLAHYLQSHGDLKEAARHYGAMALEFQDNKLAPVALFASGVCLYKLNQLEDAARDWGTLVRKYPADALAEEAYYQKGLTETRLKRDADAILSFRNLVQKFPKSRFAADGHYWLGMLLREGGKAKEAEEELRLALQSSPAGDIEKQAQFQLALLLQKNGKSEEAAGLFQALLDSPVQDKFSPALLQWLAEYKSEKGEHAESRNAARLLVERSKEPAWQQTGWCLIGRADMALGEKPQAEEAFRKALDVKASTRFGGEAAFQLGDITLAAGKHYDALKFFKQAAEGAGDDSQLGVRARAYIGMAKASKGLGDLEGASRYFMSVSILYDDSDLVPECLYEAASALKQLGKNEESRKTFKELRERYPDSDWAKKPETP